MKLFSSAIILLLFITLSAQDTLINQRLSSEEAKADFELYVRVLKETHPGLYRYQSEERINSIIDSIANRLESPIEFYDFYKALAWLNANIKCSHSYVMPTDDYERNIFQNIKVLPFFLFPVEDKTHVLFSGIAGPEVKPGYELLSINGQDIQQITTTLRKHLWADGDIELGKNMALQGAPLQLFYYSIIERPDHFKLQFADLNGQVVEVEVPALPTKVCSKNYQKNPVNKTIAQLYGKNNNKEWKLTFPDDSPSTAYLHIQGFGKKGVHSSESAAAAMAKFMDDAMKKINKKKTQNLILDLRYNSGGWDAMGVELISYFIKNDTPIPYYGPAFAVTNETEFLKYSDLSDYDKAQIDEELIPQEDGTFLLKAEYNVGHSPVSKKANAFQGQLYILIDEYTGSAAAEFAAIAKSNKLGTLIGQETNGTYGGSNGSTFIRMPLPNSKIFFRTPLVRGQNAVQAIQDLRRGVLPDHEVGYTLEHVLNRKDAQLAYVKSLIKAFPK